MSLKKSGFLELFLRILTWNFFMWHQSKPSNLVEWTQLISADFPFKSSAFYYTSNFRGSSFQVYFAKRAIQTFAGKIGWPKFAEGGLWIYSTGPRNEYSKIESQPFECYTNLSFSSSLLLPGLFRSNKNTFGHNIRQNFLNSPPLSMNLTKKKRALFGSWRHDWFWCGLFNYHDELFICSELHYWLAYASMEGFLWLFDSGAPDPGRFFKKAHTVAEKVGASSADLSRFALRRPVQWHPE